MPLRGFGSIARGVETEAVASTRRSVCSRSSKGKQLTTTMGAAAIAARSASPYATRRFWAASLKTYSGSPPGDRVLTAREVPCADGLASSSTSYSSR